MLENKISTQPLGPPENTIDRWKALGLISEDETEPNLVELYEKYKDIIDDSSTYFDFYKTKKLGNVVYVGDTESNNIFSSDDCVDDWRYLGLVTCDNKN